MSICLCLVDYPVSVSTSASASRYLCPFSLVRKGRDGKGGRNTYGDAPIRPCPCYVVTLWLRQSSLTLCHRLVLRQDAFCSPLFSPPPPFFRSFSVYEVINLALISASSFDYPMFVLGFVTHGSWLGGWERGKLVV